MSLESSLFATLQGVCPRVFPDVAPYGTQRPYVTWQQIGGTSLTYTEGSLPDRRCAYVQVNVWADTRAEANETMLAIEQAMVSASITGWTARPMSALQAAVDDDTEVRGAMQDFEIWAPR